MLNFADWLQNEVTTSDRPGIGGRALSAFLSPIPGTPDMGELTRKLELLKDRLHAGSIKDTPGGEAPWMRPSSGWEDSPSSPEAQERLGKFATHARASRPQGPRPSPYLSLPIGKKLRTKMVGKQELSYLLKDFLGLDMSELDPALADILKYYLKPSANQQRMGTDELQNSISDLVNGRIDNFANILGIQTFGTRGRGGVSKAYKDLQKLIPQIIFGLPSDTSHDWSNLLNGIGKKGGGKKLKKELTFLNDVIMKYKTEFYPHLNPTADRGAMSPEEMGGEEPTATTMKLSGDEDYLTRLIQAASKTQDAEAVANANKAMDHYRDVHGDQWVRNITSRAS